MRGLDKFGHGPQEVAVDGLGGRGHVHVVEETVDNGQHRGLCGRGAFFEDFYEKSKHVEGVPERKKVLG